MTDRCGTPARSQADWRQLADELETLDKKASEGRWYYGHGEGEGGLTRVDDGREADDALFPFYPEAHDAELICALRNEVPTILEALRTKSESGLSVTPSDEALGVLRELVDLKTLKDALDALEPASEIGSKLYQSRVADYQRRKPLAWQRAREVLTVVSSAIGTTYRKVGWAQIELRATQGGMLYEVAGSVSEERTEHHTEPVYIAVVEAADRKIDHG